MLVEVIGSSETLPKKVLIKINSVTSQKRVINPLRIFIVLRHVQGTFLKDRKMSGENYQIITSAKDQLDAQFLYFIIILLQSSTCFEQRRAHHQEVKFY